jgi:membrane-bound lytic murein transglycosylase A
MFWLGLIFLTTFQVSAQQITPTEAVVASMDFKDDLDFEHLPLAISRQLENYKRRGLAGTIQFGTKTYPRTVLKDSLIELNSLALAAVECLKISQRSVCEQEFSLKINERFDIYRPVPKSTEQGHAQKKTQFTSYYTPDFNGSRTKSDVYRNPIFSLPKTETERKYSRVEIDFDRKLDNKNLEVLWVKETLFDIYFSHIQGGGRVKLEDGSTVYLSYTGSNGKKFQFISQYLINSGLMPRATTNYWSQREFLEINPQHQRAAYETAPFFVYFKETAEEPHGLDDMSLTVSRSLAWDNTIYKSLGVINFIKTVKTTSVDPTTGAPVKTPFSRFFLAQDTGSAIRGNARCDLYWGYGEEALFVAGKLMELGEQYMLIKK